MTGKGISTANLMKPASEWNRDSDSLPSSAGLDEALKVLNGSEKVTLTPEKERALLWKIGMAPVSASLVAPRRPTNIKL